MEHKIMKTAKNLINHKEGDSLLLPNGDYSHTEYINVNMVRKLMIEFAKMHVEAALEYASGKVQLSPELYDLISDDWESDKWFDKDSILNAYPLENIK